MTLEENIKNWVKLDNEIKQLSSEMKNLRLQKENHSENILNHVKENNLEHAVIKIGDGKLKFVDTNSPQPLTYKFICECLCEYFENDNDIVMELICHIKSKRIIKKSKEIKRYIVSS